MNSGLIFISDLETSIAKKCKCVWWIETLLNSTPVFGVTYAFPKIFTVVGGSWTLDPSMEAVSCEIKPAKNKFI